MADSVEPSTPRAARFASLRTAASYLFLQPSNQTAFSSTSAAVLRWFVPLGLIVGLLWMMAFRAAWRLYGDPEYKNDRALPALAVLLLECLVLGRPLLRGLMRSAGHTEDARTRGLTFTFLWIIALWTLLERLPARTGWYPPDEYWRSWLNPFYPLATYRPLILAPLWGRWALLMAGCVGRTAAETDTVTRDLCTAIRPGLVLRWSLAPFILTGLFLVRDGLLYEGLFTGLITLLATYLAAVGLSRRHGGQTRETLFTCAAFAEVIFLIAFRALCIPTYW